MAIESSGVVGPQSMDFLRDLGRRLAHVMGETKSMMYIPPSEALCGSTKRECCFFAGEYGPFSHLRYFLFFLVVVIVLFVFVVFVCLFFVGYCIVLYYVLYYILYYVLYYVFYYVLYYVLYYDCIIIIILCIVL